MAEQRRHFRRRVEVLVSVHRICFIVSDPKNRRVVSGITTSQRRYQNFILTTKLAHQILLVAPEWVDVMMQLHLETGGLFWFSVIDGR